jgi:hypothetical protein
MNTNTVKSSQLNLEEPFGGKSVGNRWEIGGKSVGNLLPPTGPQRPDPEGLEDSSHCGLTGGVEAVFSPRSQAATREENAQARA